MIVNLFKRLRYIYHHIRPRSLPLGIISEKNKKIVILFFFCIPEWQTSLANEMAYLKSLNKLPITRVYIVAENGWLKVPELVALIHLLMHLYQHNCLFKEDMK